eukprot:GHVH01008279.1.p1 GENE.GHVH01008279.1~~GHVH01008279.1.p1  ORF type:complete len:688 (+),score=64.23 GHVH01008279.1:895-2958(+)
MSEYSERDTQKATSSPDNLPSQRVSTADATDHGDCKADDISMLVDIPKWKPWSKKSLISVVSGYQQGWYQNRNQNIFIYLVTELILGLVVVFAQVPETISFALMANMDPSFALHGAWIIGIISAVMGGRSAMVCGVTGSVSSVTAAMILATERKDFVFPIIISAGIMLVAFSLLNLSWIIRFISKSVMIGFCNGLAIIIAMAQLHMFQDTDHNYVAGEEALHMAIMCVGAMLIFNFWGKTPVLGRYIPAAFTALVFAMAYEMLICKLWRETRTVSIGDVGRLDPQFRFPRPFWLLPDVEPFTWADIATIVNKSFSFFLVMCLESLMTVSVMDTLYANKSDANQSLFAIGIGNICSGMFGGIGGNTMIGLCGLLSRSGGCGKEAPVVCAILMFVVVTTLTPYLNLFPTAGLAGIMFVVVLHTFSFDSLAMIFCSLFPTSLVRRVPWLQRRIPRLDAFILLIVTVLVPLYGLDVGIVVGMALSAFGFVRSSFRQMQVYKHTANRPTLGEVAVYDVVGPLFFASADVVHDVFDIDNDPNNIIVRMNNSAIMDYSALEVLSEVKSAYEELGKTMHVKHLTKKCEDIILLSQARLDWDKAHYDNYVVDVPTLVQFADELPCIPGMPKNSLTYEHFASQSLSKSESIQQTPHPLAHHHPLAVCDLSPIAIVPPKIPESTDEMTKEVISNRELV